MNPLIASYTDFSSNSVHKIQKKYEALKVYSKKRKYSFQEAVASADSHMLTNKAPDKFSVRPLVVVDSRVPETGKPEKKERPCTARKPQIDNKSEQPRLNWNFTPLTKHREGWLFSLVRPETDFVKTNEVKKIPVSLEAAVLKNSISARLHKNPGNPEAPDNCYEKVEEPEKNYENEIRDKMDEAEEKQEEQAKNPEDIEYKCYDPEILQYANQNPTVSREHFNKAAEKYFGSIQPLNNQFTSEYRSQFQNCNTAKALKELKQAYSLNS